MSDCLFVGISVTKDLFVPGEFVALKVCRKTNKQATMLTYQWMWMYPPKVISKIGIERGRGSGHVDVVGRLQQCRLFCLSPLALGLKPLRNRSLVVVIWLSKKTTKTPRDAPIMFAKRLALYYR